MRRTLLATIWALVAMVIFPLAGVARVAFCSADPIYLVDGHEVAVLVELSPPDIAERISSSDPVKVVLEHPKGTSAEVVWVGGDFPEQAEIKEGKKDNKASVKVSVPDVSGFERLRVTVFKDGEQVAQKETPKRQLKLSFKWDGDD